MVLISGIFPILRDNLCSGTIHLPNILIAKRFLEIYRNSAETFAED